MYSIAINITMNAPVHNQTPVENGRRNKLFWYDKGGCLNTNFNVIGVGWVKYSKIVIRSFVMNVTIPKTGQIGNYIPEKYKSVSQEIGLFPKYQKPIT